MAEGKKREIQEFPKDINVNANTTKKPDSAFHSVILLAHNWVEIEISNEKEQIKESG